MTIQMPVIKQTPSPNYSPTLIAHDLCVVHMCEGGYAGSTAWLCRPSVGASAHLIMSEDGSEVSQLVPLQFKAWAQCQGNGKGISLEIPGITAQGIPETRWRAAALIVAWLCRAYAIPPVWAQGGQGRGVAQHHDGGVAWGGHVDCSGIGSPTWFAFMGYVKDAYDAFGNDLLPPFALHGAPAAHATELPPNVHPEPSHGGVPRIDNGATPSHQTASGYPDGSCADLQYRLNKAGASPALTIDGLAGDATRIALRSFQATHGLAIDAVAGPATWSALHRATA